MLTDIIVNRVTDSIDSVGFTSYKYTKRRERDRCDERMDPLKRAKASLRSIASVLPDKEMVEGHDVQELIRGQCGSSEHSLSARSPHAIMADALSHWCDAHGCTGYRLTYWPDGDVLDFGEDAIFLMWDGEGPDNLPTFEIKPPPCYRPCCGCTVEVSKLGELNDEEWVEFTNVQPGDDGFKAACREFRRRWELAYEQYAEEETDDPPKKGRMGL